MTQLVTLNVARGLNKSGLPERLPASQRVRIFWTNLNFGQPTLKAPAPTPPTGDAPISLILEMLTSTGSTDFPNRSGPLVTNYDVLPSGIGMGIPEDQIDLQSFEKIQASPDYDTRLALGFAFISPVPAKDFLEEELCRPFGYYLSTGTDGRIRIVQPRHPQKFYIGSSNCELANNIDVTPSEPMWLTPGVYTAYELATAVTKGFQKVFGTTDVPNDFCTYDSSAHQFRIRGDIGNYPMSLVLESATGANGVARSVWGTMGYTSLPASKGGDGLIRSSTGVGALPATIPALSEKDLWGVQILDNRADQITNVIYRYDYDYSTGRYRQAKHYFDANSFDCAGSLTNAEYEIRTKGCGFATAIATTTSHQAELDHWSGAMFPSSSGCDVISVRMAKVDGGDGDTSSSHMPPPASPDPNAWAQLVAATLIDRYRQPPLKFRARLKWTWNTLQVGDVVVVNYSIPGIFTDFERNATTLSNRLFEITELHVNYDGSVDATFLGHRYVSY